MTKTSRDGYELAYSWLPKYLSLFEIPFEMDFAPSLVPYKQLCRFRFNLNAETPPGESWNSYLRQCRGDKLNDHGSRQFGSTWVHWWEHISLPALRVIPSVMHYFSTFEANSSPSGFPEMEIFALRPEEADKPVSVIRCVLESQRGYHQALSNWFRPRLRV